MAPPNYAMIERALKAVAPPPSSGGYGNAPAPYIGPGPSPLVASYNDWGPYAGGHSLGTNAALPRDWMTFLSGMFGPLSPFQPVPIDLPEPGEERPPPRVKQLTVGWNLPTPPGTEGIGKLTDFASLRTIADLYSVARRCIQLRKDELRGIGWDIGPTREAAKAMRGDHRAAKDFSARQAKLVRFFRKPDPNYLDFGSWFNALAEEMFVTDAPALYLHPSRLKRHGVLGSDIAALEIIDGASVRPLVDIRGSIPAPPNPAWQQYEFGVPRVDLMSLRAGADLDGISDGDVIAEYRSDQLLYFPYSPRSWSPYGQSFLETALVPVITGIHKQSYQMQYYTEGSIPGVYIMPGDPSLTAGQLKVLQDAFNAIATDQAWKHKGIVLPGGSKVEPMKPWPLADELDTLIQIETCMGFDVQPFEIGVQPQLSAAAASSGAARQMVGARIDIRQRKSTIPILLFLKAAIFDWVIQEICGQKDMEWKWSGLEEDENVAELTEALVAQIGAGLLSIDEGRQILGREPWNLPITSDPGWATQWGGLVPLTGVTEATAQPLGGSPGPGGPGRGARSLPGGGGAPVDLTAPGAVTRPGSPAAPATVPRNRMSPAQRRGQAHQVSTTQNRTGAAGTPAHSGARAHPAAGPGGNRARKAILGALTAQTLGEFQAATGTPLWASIPQVIQGDVEKEASAATPGAADSAGLVKAARELGLLRAHLRRGEPVSAWEPRHIPLRVLGDIAEHMAKGMSGDEACEAAKLALTAAARKGASGYDLNPRSGMISLDLPEGLLEPLPGGVDDHHVTVVYLGPDVDDEALAAACERAQEAALAMPGPLAGHVGGIGSFPPSESSDGKVPVFAQMHLPGAESLRAALEDLSASEHPGWTPHVTLAYLDEDDPLPDPRDPVPVQFTHLSVHRGGRVVARFPLGGVAKEAERYVTCSQGHRHWGAHGAAGLLIRARDSAGRWRYLLQQQAAGEDAGLWGTPGGALHEGEPATMGALREALEELGELPGLRPQHVITDDHGGWAHHTIVCDAPGIFAPPVNGATAHETGGWAWLRGSDVGSYPLRPGFAATWPAVRRARRSKTLTKGAPKTHGSPAGWRVVYDQLRDNYPPHAIAWVKDAAWELAEVPLADIDFDDEHSWAAAHEHKRVRHFARLERAGQHVHPPVLVREQGNDHLPIVDGHHRTLGAREAGKTSQKAYVGTVPKGDDRWRETHSSQVHQGSSPANKATLLLEGGDLKTGSKKSARTPYVSTVHHKLGNEGLWHTPDKHVAHMQELPARCLHSEHRQGAHA